MGGTSADISICQDRRAGIHHHDLRRRLPADHAGGQRRRDRCRRRIDPLGRRAGPAQGRAALGRRRSRPGGLWPGRDRAHRHRLLSGDRHPRSRRGSSAARCRSIGTRRFARSTRSRGSLGFQAPVEAAEAALRVASAKMATEIIKLLATAGADPREFALVAYGGAGPTHAVLLAEEARLDAVLVPMTPGRLLRAWRGSRRCPARLRPDRASSGRRAGRPGGRSRWLAAHRGGHRTLAGGSAGLGRARGRAGRRASPLGIGEHALSGAGLRTGHPVARRGRPSASAWCDAFHAEHYRLYGFSNPGSAVQVTTVRLGVIGKVPPVALPTVAQRQPEKRGNARVLAQGAAVRGCGL